MIFLLYKCWLNGGMETKSVLEDILEMRSVRSCWTKKDNDLNEVLLAYAVGALTEMHQEPRPLVAI